MNTKLDKLPPTTEVETKTTLKLAAQAHKYLGELKGVAQTIPNDNILLGLLPLQEAQSSSEIENIITTTDDLYKSKIENSNDVNVKEVRNYEQALLDGFAIVKKDKLLTNNTICQMQAKIVAYKSGFRTQSGTVLKNNLGETIYTPPQQPSEIVGLMSDLEKFINDDAISAIDPLIKMALIHHQFESIHPFYDGNGRVGRIMCILYLCQKDLLDLPILYLSRYIIRHKNQYYQLLQTARDKNEWQKWVCFMLDGIVITAKESILLITEIRELMQSVKQTIRDKYPKIYSQDLVNALFTYPYTKVEFIEQQLGIHNQTARNYLNKLTTINLLSKKRTYRENYYTNELLIDLAIEVSAKFHKENKITSN